MAVCVSVSAYVINHVKSWTAGHGCCISIISMALKCRVKEKEDERREAREETRGELMRCRVKLVSLSPITIFLDHCSYMEKLLQISRDQGLNDAELNEMISGNYEHQAGLLCCAVVVVVALIAKM